MPTSRATRVTSDAKSVELVHHGVDGVLELQNFAADVDGDLAREVAARDGGGHLGDVAHLVGEVAAHGVDRVGQIFPCPRNAWHDSLSAELAVSADFAGDACHFRSERAQLIHHRVDGFLELQDLAAHVDGDLLGKVAVGDGDGDFRDIAHLGGQVACHRVHAFGQVLPDACDLADLSLATQFALGADFARDASHFRSEHAELLDHRVDDACSFQELALERAAVDIQPDSLEKIALGDGGNGGRDLLGWPDQIIDQCVDRRFHLAPCAAGEAEFDAVTGFAFASD